MKNIGLVTILVCSALVFAAAQNSADSGGRSNILALEHAWDQAQERGDVKALAAIFDNSLIYVDYDGRLLTKAEYLARVKANTAHIQQIVAEGMSVQLFGNTAIVVGTYRLKSVDSGSQALCAGALLTHGYSRARTGSALRRHQPRFYADGLRAMTGARLSC